ncbi:hypothetical protein TTHERM_01015980 (macronuclear) [Tetrahymena thermophila SB210]|uniref:Uncharacterized protein n=1 Tax=Tetrahymena thermophila (strain SB210) TaxID=312017 RepID=Q22CU3_TETTS|nr:hypothetical protein TTHERM_01015980 [Tetrahymena thermophila SB210]EAR83095.1 hypothetical protein TTHERM_01015980 [Tetrahymena thermophila SB210]|eukprot:XP_001030758.1 hypothetical protein TTHERM_01015980 [Tetrahymena thermophila SB210]
MRRSFQQTTNILKHNLKSQIQQRLSAKSLLCVPKQNFWNQKWVVFQKDDNTLNAQKGKAMAQTSDAGVIKDFDDKFGLAKITDPNVILGHLQECQFSYSMNDLVYFLRKLVQLHKDQKQFKDKREFKALVEEIKDRLENDRHEQYPLIGSYAKCFKDLGVYDKRLWELLEYKVNEDQWYTNFKESLFALEGFTILKGTNDQVRIDYLYEKLERIIDLTVWDQQMTDYKRVVEALAEVNRFEPAIFAKIEMYILRNMSLDYDIKTIVDILYAFGKGEIGQKEFYDAVQITIYKGHLFNRNPLLKTVELPYNGETTSKLLKIFTNAKKLKEFELNPNFVVYMYKMLMSNNTKYNLVNLIDTMKYLSHFQFDTQDEIENHLMNQIPKIEGQVYFKDIQYAIEFLNYKACGKFENTPLHIQRQLYQYIINLIPGSQPADLLDMHQFLIQRDLLKGQEGEIILDLMLTYLNEKMLQIEPKQIEQLLQQIENHIKIVTENEKSRIEHFSTQRNKIRDYLLVCKFTKREEIQDQSKVEEIPRVEQKYSFDS